MSRHIPRPGTPQSNNRNNDHTILGLVGIVFFIVLASTCSSNDQTAPQALSSQASSTASTAQQNTPPVATHQANNISCKVVAISDGDTFSCLTNKKKQIKVRLNQIDAPEKKQDFGTTAKNALADFIFNKIVRLETAGKDKYGRTLAEVYVNDNNINKAMVADGYAWAYREYMRDSEYANLESQARSNTVGLWSQPNPIYPSDFRHKKPTSVQTTQPVSKPLSQPVEPVQSIATPAAPSRGNHCGSKRYCKEMNDCAEAYFYLEQCGVSRLDRDSDGVPCESICN